MTFGKTVRETWNLVGIAYRLYLLTKNAVLKPINLLEVVGTQPGGGLSELWPVK